MMVKFANILGLALFFLVRLPAWLYRLVGLSLICFLLPFVICSLSVVDSFCSQVVNIIIVISNEYSLEPVLLLISVGIF